MKRLSLATALLLVSQPAFGGDANSNGWSVSGNIRTAFISDDGDSYDDEVHDLATGGSITVLTPKIENNFQIGATLYTAQPLFGQKTDKWLTEHDGSSYSYLGEAYITGVLFGKTAVILGRKVIDTPFADSDDIGMAPNSFEVYLVQNSDIPNFTFTAGRVTKWAGHDAPVRGEFSDLTGGDGASVFAVNYANSDLGLEGQAWYYHLDNLEDKVDVGIFYVDGTYSLDIDDKTSISLSGQFTRYQQINGPEDDGSVGGVQGEFSYNGLTVALAYNQADGDVAPNNGFGGGPFYTSSDLWSIEKAGNDSTAFKGSISYDINEKISVSGSYLTMTPDEGDDLTEADFGLSYAYNDNLAIDFYAEQTDDGTNTDQEYSIFVNYGF